MYTLTRPHTTTASFAHKLILLVLVAGVLDPGPGRDRQIVKGIEVLFRASQQYAPLDGTRINPVAAGTRDFHALPAYASLDWQYGTVRPRQTIGQVTTRPLSSPCIATTPCNIAHQNADEDEAFVYLTAVA